MQKLGFVCRLEWELGSFSVNEKDLIFLVSVFMSSVPSP